MEDWWIDEQWMDGGCVFSMTEACWGQGAQQREERKDKCEGCVVCPCSLFISPSHSQTQLGSGRQRGMGRSELRVLSLIPEFWTELRDFSFSLSSCTIIVCCRNVI